MSFSVLSLITFLFPLAYSPGPGNMFFAANGARFGFRSTIGANLGYHAATLVVTIPIGLGLESGLDSHPSIFNALKLAGSLYVFWLAWKLWRSGELAGQAEVERVASAKDGAVLLFLNPKAYVIMAVMFTQFLERDVGSRFVSVVQITVVFTLNNMIAFVAWTLLGDALTKGFRSPASARRLNVGLSIMLAAVALWILVA